MYQSENWSQTGNCGWTVVNRPKSGQSRAGLTFLLANVRCAPRNCRCWASPRQGAYLYKMVRIAR